jgi:hypothetical protein
VPDGTSAFNHLCKLCKEGMIKRGLQNKPEYIERLKEELSVIKQMKNEAYFISYQKIMELARKVCLVGPARGSGGGSLVAYVLYITDLDPLKWDLPFARFLNVYRCLSPDTKVLMSDGSSSALRDVKVGDSVVSHDGSHRKVTFIATTKHEKTYRVKVNGTTFTCSKNHVWLTVGPDGQPVEKRTFELTTNDKLYTYHYEHR